MKLLLFICFVTFSFVLAQEPVTPLPSDCYLGSTDNGRGNVSTRACDFGTESCMTKVETQNNIFKLVRECTQTLACRNNAAGNVPKCYPGENNIRICFFCCTGHLCNVELTAIPEQMGATTPEPDGGLEGSAR